MFASYSKYFCIMMMSLSFQSREINKFSNILDFVSFKELKDCMCPHFEHYAE